MTKIWNTFFGKYVWNLSRLVGKTVARLVGHFRPACFMRFWFEPHEKSEISRGLFSCVYIELWSGGASHVFPCQLNYTVIGYVGTKFGRVVTTNMGQSSQTGKELITALMKLRIAPAIWQGCVK